MRLVVGCVTGVLLSAASLRAQEAEVYAAMANPGPGSSQASGVGLAIGGFLRLSDIFSERNVLGRSAKRIGLRLSYARLRSVETSGPVCLDPLGGQCFPPHPVDARLDLRQATLVFEPYLSRRVSAEVGGSVVNYRYAGEQHRQTTGLAATLRVAGRVTQSGPWWVLAEYARHGNAITPTPAGGTTLRVPDQSLRAGVAYRAPLSLRPRPEH